MEKMKKITSLLLAIFMSSSLAVMTACNGGGKTSDDSSKENTSNSAEVNCDEHVYSEDFICVKEPTCLEVGKKAIACVNCGSVKGNTADITARGHDIRATARAQHAAKRLRFLRQTQTLPT